MWWVEKTHLHQLLDGFEKPPTVGVVGEPVVEHSQRLVHPQPRELRWFPNARRGRRGYHLEHFRDVPQVKGVVTFRGRGE